MVRGAVITPDWYLSHLLVDHGSQDRADIAQRRVGHADPARLVVHVLRLRLQLMQVMQLMRLHGLLVV